jgi:hypothetical protein
MGTWDFRSDDCVNCFGEGFVVVQENPKIVETCTACTQESWIDAVDDFLTE